MSRSQKKVLPQYKGHLTPEQAATGIRITRENARALVEDAKLLLGHRRWARACALAILAIEEMGKSVYILRILGADTQEALKEAWRDFRSHTQKNRIGPFLHRGVNLVVSGKSLGKGDLAYFTSLLDDDDEGPQIVDETKQFCFYSDCYDNEKGYWSSPQEVISEEQAQAYVDVARRIAQKPSVLMSGEALAAWKELSTQDTGPMEESLGRLYEEFAKRGIISEETLGRMKTQLGL